MRKFRIDNYGLFSQIFDVEMKTWYGWTLVKRFRAKSSDPFEIEYAKRLAEELLEKLEEEVWI